MDSNYPDSTKPASQSSTIKSAIAAILTPLVGMVVIYLNSGTIPIEMLLVEVPIILTQGKIIAERFKRGRADIA